MQLLGVCSFCAVAVVLSSLLGTFSYTSAGSLPSATLPMAIRGALNRIAMAEVEDMRSWRLTSSSLAARLWTCRAGASAPGAVHSAVAPITTAAGKRRTEASRAEQARVKRRQLTASRLLDSRTSFGVDLGADFGFLEQAAVQEKTFKRYMGFVRALAAFGGGRPLERLSATELDGLMVDWMEDRYCEGGDSNEGAQMLSAVQALWPEFGRLGPQCLPRAARSLRGWSRLAPGASRPPHAFAVVAGIAMRLAQKGHLDMGLWVLVGAAGYLRPGENMRLRGRDFIRPVGGQVRLWTILVCSSELEVPSKVGEFDDSIVWDHAELQFMTRVFGKFAEKNEELAWRFSYHHLCAMFGEVVAELRVQNMVPYSLRHSGASWDATSGRRSLQGIQKRGRWKSHKSLVRYEKSGRIGVEYAKIPVEVRTWMERCVSRLPHIVQNSRSLGRPPGC